MLDPARTKHVIVSALLRLPPSIAQFIARIIRRLWRGFGAAL